MSVDDLDKPSTSSKKINKNTDRISEGNVYLNRQEYKGQDMFQESSCINYTNH